MGFEKIKRPLKLPRSVSVGPNAVANLTTAVGGINQDVTFAAATNGVKFGRLVRVKTDGAVVPTTGTLGRAGIGISKSSASSGSNVDVRVFGVANGVASTAAVAKGAFLRGVGAGSTATSAGTLIAQAASTTINHSVIGMALTSAAAAAISTGRTVKVLILHQGTLLV